MKKSQFTVLWIIILGLGLAVRFYNVEAIPAGLYWDEVAILLDAKSIADTGLDIHSRPWFQALFPSYGDYKLPVYIWMTSLFVKIFGVHDWVVRLPNVLAGGGSIILAGLLAKDLFNLKTKTDANRLQLIAMVVVAFLPWSILFSRTGFEGHFGQFLLAASIWIGLKGRKHFLWGVLSAVIGSFAVYTYFSVRFVWPVVFILSQLFLIKDKKIKKILKPQSILAIIFPLVVFGSLLIPMFQSPLYEVNNQLRLSTDSILNSHDYAIEANLYRQLAGNTIFDRVLFHRHWLMVRELLINLSDFFDFSFLFIQGDLNLRHGTGQFGLLLLTTAPFLFWGAYASWKNHNMLTVLLLGWWLAAVIPAAVPEETPHALRSLNALMPVSIFIGFGFYQGMSYLRSQKIKLGLKRGVLTVVSLLLVSELAAFLGHYFFVYPQVSYDSWQGGYKQEAKSLWREADLKPTEEIQPANSDDRFYLWLLLYGDLTSEEVQAIPKENYRPAQIGNIILP